METIYRYEVEDGNAMCEACGSPITEDLIIEMEEEMGDEVAFFDCPHCNTLIELV